MVGVHGDTCFRCLQNEIARLISTLTEQYQCHGPCICSKQSHNSCLSTLTLLLYKATSTFANITHTAHTAHSMQCKCTHVLQIWQLMMMQESSRNLLIWSGCLVKGQRAAPHLTRGISVKVCVKFCWIVQLRSYTSFLSNTCSICCVQEGPTADLTTTNSETGRVQL